MNTEQRSIRLAEALGIAAKEAALLKYVAEDEAHDEPCQPLTQPLQLNS
jgi:hypothetical protein